MYSSSQRSGATLAPSSQVTNLNLRDLPSLTPGVTAEYKIGAPAMGSACASFPPPQVLSLLHALLSVYQDLPSESARPMDSNPRSPRPGSSLVLVPPSEAPSFPLPTAERPEMRGSPGSRGSSGALSPVHSQSGDAVGRHGWGTGDKRRHRPPRSTRQATRRWSPGAPSPWTHEPAHGAGESRLQMPAEAGPAGG